MQGVKDEMSFNTENIYGEIVDLTKCLKTHFIAYGINPDHHEAEG